MKWYKCRTCNELQQHEQIRGTPVPCTNTSCNAGIAGGQVYYGSDVYKHARFAADNKKSRGAVIGRARVGRSPSAPPQTDADDLPLYPPNGTAYVADVAATAWKSVTARTKVRLAYKELVTGNAKSQGMIIDPPQALGAKLLAHFQAVAKCMAAVHKPEDEAEGTGEAAAAWAMAFGNTYPGYQMLWGFDTHSGAGIDQIWGEPDLGTGYSAYVIVEAKGVGQSLGANVHAPGQLGVQMSHDWVVDRLARMSDPLGAQVLNDVGLVTGKQINTTGASKNYYEVTVDNHTPGTDASLYGVVFTARWTAGPKLSWSVSNNVTYYA
jgi:hypothetical protein